jgi:hypothetical protein
VADLSALVADERHRAGDLVYGAGLTTGATTPRMAGLRERVVKLADTLSVSINLAARPGEHLQPLEGVYGAGRTTGAGTPQMAGLRDTLALSDGPAAATVQDPLEMAYRILALAQELAVDEPGLESAALVRAAEDLLAALGVDVRHTAPARADPLAVGVWVEVKLAGLLGPWTNLGRDVVTADGISIRRGMQGGGPDDNVASTGTASFSLNNSAANSAHLLGYYSLYHANKRAGWALDIPCRVRFEDPTTGTIYTRFVGLIDSISPSAGQYLDRRVRVQAVDWMDDAARWALTAAVGEQAGKRWDQVASAIVTQMPTQPVGQSFDAGVETYAFSLDSSAFAQQTALAEFKKLADSERGVVYLTAAGILRFEGRHTRLLNTTSVWVLTDTEINGLAVPSTRNEIIDTVRVTIHPKLVDVTNVTVYDQANVITIQPGATQLLLGSFRDQITGDTMGGTDIQPLVPGTDWLANSLADGTGTNLTGSFTVAMTKGASGLSFSVVNASAVVGYLTKLVVRGKGIRDKATVQLQSPTTTGSHVYALDMPYQDSSDVGQGAADYYVQKYNTAYAQARTGSVPGKTTALVSAILQREVSDRVTIHETVVGLANDYFINGVQERVLPSGHLMATYTLAPAPADQFTGAYWVLDSSILGTSTVPSGF